MKSYITKLLIQKGSFGILANFVVEVIAFTQRILFKKIMLIIISLFSFSSMQAQIISKNIEFFGGVGDSSTDNTEAFIKAGIYFSNLPSGYSGELIISSFYPVLSTNPAYYLVGKQLRLGQNYSVTQVDSSGISHTRNFDHSLLSQGLITGIDTGMLYLKNILNGMVIRGSDSLNPPTVRYWDSLHFGSFLKPGYTFTSTGSAGTLTQTNSSTTDTIALSSGVWGNGNYDATTSAWIGNFITLYHSHNISIKYLIIDGNNAHIKWGGIYQDKGIQSPHRGIYCWEADSIIIENVQAVCMGYDGIEIKRGDDVYISDCKFLKNTRQGMSWTSGVFLKVTGTEFSETGKNNASILSNPGAGLDIEPETVVGCMNGVFNNCVFRNNVGRAIDNEHGGDTKDVKFYGCTFKDHDIGYGLWLKGKSLLFDSSYINCSVMYGYSGDTLDYATKFKKCQFDDLPDSGVHWLNNYKLVEMVGACKAQFDSCSFTVYDEIRTMLFITSPILEASFNVFKDCEFNYNNLGTTNTTQLDKVIFKGHNKVRNTLNAVNSFHTFNTIKCIVEGSEDECLPTLLEFEGQLVHGLPSNSLSTSNLFRIGKNPAGDNGYATYLIKNNALSSIQSNTEIEVGKNAQFEIEKGGSLFGAGHYYIGGKMILNNGSYMNLNTSSFDNLSGSTNPLFYIDKHCNKGTTTTSPIWCNGIGFATGDDITIYHSNWVGTVDTGLCIQGGHDSISSSLCTPIYTNIISKHSLSMLYNTSIGCFGSGTSSISFSVKGGSPPYFYKLDGIDTTSTSFSNLNNGLHTITVIDSNCTEHFVIHLDTAFSYTILKGCTGTTPARIKTNACSQPQLTGPSLPSYNSSTGIFSISTAGTYILTAISGSDTIIKTIYFGKCDSCTGVDTLAEWYIPNASSTSMFASGIAPSSPIVLSGNINIDSALFIYRNAKVFLTPATELEVDSTASLVINKSNLTGCNNYWKGITANGINRTVIVNNNSKIQDMSDGILIKNDAFLQARNTTFLNNALHSITLENLKIRRYDGMIWKNVFTSDTNFITYLGETQPTNGISIQNCTDLDIGNRLNNTYGNKFSNMRNGIFVHSNSNISSDLDSYTNEIGLYGNKFENIKSDYTGVDLLGSTYNTPRGAGVYIDYGYSPNFNAQTVVSNILSAAANDTTFYECDKAVVSINNNLTDSALHITKCMFGIMNTNCEGKYYRIKNNAIEEAMVGIQCIGDNVHSQIVGNFIQCNQSMTTADNFYEWGKGIDIHNFLNSNNDSTIIRHNTISMDSYAGIGIGLSNTGANAKVDSNVIWLNHIDDGVLVSYNSTLLSGIYASNTDSSGFNNNTVNGNNSLIDAEREDIAGILINHSNRNTVHCNYVTNTRFGIQAISDCSTDSVNGINGNIMYNQALGWVFRHLGTEGTFGQVGTQSQDNNNIFAGNNLIYKVFKFCDSSQAFIIFTNTNTVNLSESGSHSINSPSAPNPCPYDVAQNQVPSETYTCPSVIIASLSDDNTFDFDEAIAIATHTKLYDEFAEVAAWMDERKLYNQLESNVDFRNRDSILINFHYEMGNQIIALLNETDNRIQALIASMQSQDTTLYLQRLQEASQSNSNIVSERDQDENEAAINNIYLKYIEFGRDSIYTEDSTFISELAKQCPYIGGTAVYKARMLNAVYAPTQTYDDIKFCNTIGVYKNDDGSTTGRFDAENNYLKTIKTDIKNKILKDDEMLVYPNPANEQITIKYKINNTQSGTFIMYDILGREVLEITLSGNSNYVSVSTVNLGAGIYIYKYSVEHVQKKSGKLIIE